MSRMTVGRIEEIKQVLAQTPEDERDTADATIAELVEEVDALIEDVITYRAAPNIPDGLRADFQKALSQAHVDAVATVMEKWRVMKGWKDRALKSSERALKAEAEVEELRKELRNLRTELRLREGSSLHPGGGM